MLDHLLMTFVLAFAFPKQTIGKELARPLMERFLLLSTRPRFPFFGVPADVEAARTRAKVVLHRFMRGDDREKGIHNHPWRFASIVLCGSYTERYRADDGSERERVRGPGSIALRSPDFHHIVTEVDGPCWTLAILGPWRQAWGFPDLGKTIRDANGRRTADENEQEQPTGAKPREHVEHRCECRRTGCMFCDGGLSACDVCGAFEGATPTHCPGEEMTEAQREEVYAGTLNFRDGMWRTGEASGSCSSHYGEDRTLAPHVLAELEAAGIEPRTVPEAQAGEAVKADAAPAPAPAAFQQYRTHPQHGRQGSNDGIVWMTLPDQEQTAEPELAPPEPTTTSPRWFETAIPIWQEDDAGTPDRERIGPAWRRLFGEDVPITNRNAVAIYDAGDSAFVLHTHGRIVGCEIGLGAIYLTAEAFARYLADRETARSQLAGEIGKYAGGDRPPSPPAEMLRRERDLDLEIGTLRRAAARAQRHAAARAAGECECPPPPPPVEAES